MLTYVASIPLSTRSLTRLTTLINARRRELGARWRALPAHEQALMSLAHLRNGDTLKLFGNYLADLDPTHVGPGHHLDHVRDHRGFRKASLARLAAGFSVGLTTVWRYLREAIDLLTAEAADVAAAARRTARLTYAILDGTLTPIDCVADQKPYYSGKHQRHSVNVQVLADAAGRLVWASPALPGTVHDLTAAWAHGLLEALSSAYAMTFADKGYQGAGGMIRTPFKRHLRRPKLSRRQKAVNDSYARIRALGERAVAILKSWRVLTKLRCCPRRATAIVQAILVLQHAEDAHYTR